MIAGLSEDDTHVIVATARGYPPSEPVNASPGDSVRIVLAAGGRVLDAANGCARKHAGDADVGADAAADVIASARFDFSDDSD